MDGLNLRKTSGLSDLESFCKRELQMWGTYKRMCDLQISIRHGLSFSYWSVCLRN